MNNKEKRLQRRKEHIARQKEIISTARFLISGGVGVPIRVVVEAKDYKSVLTPRLREPIDEIDNWKKLMRGRLSDLEAFLTIEEAANKEELKQAPAFAYVKEKQGQVYIYGHCGSSPTRVELVRFMSVEEWNNF